MKYEIEWEILDEYNNRSNNGTSFVEGKSEKDAIKSWIYFSIDEILVKSFMEEWIGRSFKINHIRKAEQVKSRPKNIMK